MHPFLEDGKFLAFAHRGGALEAPENTAEAFERAIEMGYRFIETDVQLTSDGVVVIFHDDILDRVTDGAGRVNDRTWDEISRLKVHGAGGIPRLQDVLSTWPDIRFNIDAKTDEVAAPLCAIAASHNPERLCLASSSDKRIRFIRSELGNRVCTTAATWETAGFLLPALLGLPSISTDADCLQVPVTAYGLQTVSPRTLERVRSCGKAMHLWTIDDEVEMEQFAAKGIGGIMTDRPTLLRTVLNTAGLWR